MKTAKPIRSEIAHLQLILAALMVTFLIFFMDEGYFNVSWSQFAGNGVMFAIYAGLFYASEFILYSTVFRNQSSWKRILASIIVGLPAFIVVVVLGFTAFKLLLGQV